MRELHLFAGCGGGILGGILLGHTTVCAVEIEPYCRKVLLQRQRDGILPKFPIWDDVRTFDGKPWRDKVEVVCGGFPCTDIAVCKPDGKGLEGTASGLWHEQKRVISEIRPRYAFIENSPMLTVRGGNRVLSDLTEMGYNCRWGVVGGNSAGLCVDGKRFWLLADASNGKRWTPASVQTRALHTENGTSFRRQFDRAISACSRPDAHATMQRDTDGLARAMDRLKAIGNGQVPAVVKLAWETLSA